LVANTTPENKAKNRRIEIILTPKLDEISKMLSDF
jgi:chemotaxis protein MotB